MHDIVEIINEPYKEFKAVTVNKKKIKNTTLVHKKTCLRRKAIRIPFTFIARVKVM